VPERELIERVLAGDARAERTLYDTHVDRVYRLCYRIADGDAELAQEFTQQAFVRAFDRLRHFRGQSAFATWLHAVATSVALNGLRQLRRLRERETHSLEDVQLAVAPRVAEPDLKERLRDAIAGLPEPYRVVFLMYDVEGYTHEEIGTMLDMPTGTSKARLSRARARLRDALADFAGEWAT
jgi:RNA polymerase sigma-70 factor, ECF subfamily